ncbi:D-Ala-D-Ala carboxypeptidase family metallohydrolase [Acinetobacter stercoris]|uniref:Uncharacterized protein n=1 Tax=Acinetobacter stercoris TaxID=2126983 RepID=A0A2U3N482_9GAMM|nr:MULTISPECIES: D-Ala-D-Ala carboxypeptidase family metallohydrolase [Acinetobacter]SPL72369.1 hypothetical protein KPC_3547 [Acinetobacter stercoris]
MKYILKGLLAVSIVPMMMIGCTSSPQKTQTQKSSGHRIYIPQEKVIVERPIPPKVTPNSYLAWLSQPNNQAQTREYEHFLEQNGVGHVIPSFELFRTARDWEKCGRDQYMVPNRELWRNQIPTLRIFKYLIAAKILTDFEITSVYRDLPLNQCAGGAGSSRHLFNSAMDFRIGPATPSPEDYAFIENTKFKLCQFWAQHGQSLNMGLGLYASGQIHIDTQGFRTWGPDHSRNSSMCSNF